MIKVLTFGTFDGIHEGHRAMLRGAKALGDYLVVAVAPDSVVEEIKGKVCVSRSAKRIEDVRKERIADEVVLGDKILNKWDILKRYKPDIIALGYDQQEVKAALEAFLFTYSAEYVNKQTGNDGEDDSSESYLKKSGKIPKIVMLKPYQPEKYKSSLINN